ncbi:MAG: hypothetical protein HRU15_08895 [Planctomycetes bacterium]|nr:hypothetical protein [Planctomycetota bacterium]
MDDILSQLNFTNADIFFVSEDIDLGEITMTFDYPTDFENNIFETRKLRCIDCIEQTVGEGPFQGRPTVLDFSYRQRDDGYWELSFDTNAGTRTIVCNEVEFTST